MQCYCNSKIPELHRDRASARRRTTTVMCVRITQIAFAGLKTPRFSVIPQLEAHMSRGGSLVNAHKGPEAA
jgi:hypothetical protein